MLKQRDTFHLDINLKYIFISGLVGILNAILCHSRQSSLIMVVIELIFLAYFLVTKNLFKYACYYLIFLTMSLEYAGYYGNDDIWGFREIRIKGVGVSTLAIIPIVIVGLLKNRNNITKIKSKDSLMERFIKKSYWLFLLALVMGLFNLAIGDNGINNLPNPIMAFCGELYNYVILFIFPLISFSFIIRYYNHRNEELKSVLVSILYGIVITQIFSFLTPYKGTTWESNSLLVTFVLFYVPVLLCFAFYFNGKKRIVMFAIGILGTMFSTVYTLTSGGILVVFIVPILVIIILKERGEDISLMFWVMIVVIATLLGISMLNVILRNASILLEYKLSQALSLLKVWDSDWYTHLPNSAKFRFQEFSNIFQEYNRKPYYLLLGKGIMGTCMDYNNTFMSSSYVGEGAFSKIEWGIKAFFSMHESINVLFLSSGLYGLYYLIWTVKICVKNLYGTPFLAIGITYILFHFTYSFTVSNFCITCLLAGLYEIDKSRMDLVCL